jgi:myo-inositol 2-dehydrogenase / D-chiro-inositol 1-dehydrogenase
MPRQARLGFVGAGSHARSNLYPSIVEAPSAWLVAVCDLREERAVVAAKRYGADRWYTDVEAMLDAGGLDGVCICGEPAMHLSVGLQVLRRGLPIFVEKPSAMTARQAQRLAEAAESRGLWGMVAFMKRHAPGYRLAKQLIDAPKFGGLQQLHVRFTQGEYPDIWGLRAVQAFLVGQVVHIFDLTRFLGGDVAEVHARLRTVTPHRFGYAVSVAFASGAVGTMTLSALDHGEPWRDIDESVEASGVGENVSVRDMWDVSYQPADDWRPEETRRWGASRLAWSPNFITTINGRALTGYVGELEHFAQCVLSGQPATASLRDGAEALRFAEAVWKSAQTGKAAKLTTP